MATIASLSVDIIANTATFARDLAKGATGAKNFKKTITKDFNNLKRSARDLEGQIFNVRNALGVLASAAVLGAVVKAKADAAHQAMVYSRALKTNIQDLTAWQYAARTVNVEGDKMADIFKDVSEKIGDAFANNGGEAVEVMQRLNLDIKEMASLSPDQQLLKVAGALGDVGTNAEKVQILESLASDASLLLPLLDNNAEGLKKLRDEAIASGNAISEIDAAQLEAANQALMRAGGIVSGLANRFTVELAPYLEVTANWFLENAKQAGGVGEVVNSAMDGAVTAIGYVLTALDYMKIGWETIRLGVLTFAAVSLKALDAVVEPIRYINELLGVEQPEAFHVLTAMVEGFEQAAINSQAKLVGLISTVGQNAETAKGALKEIKQAADEVAQIQVQTAQQQDNSAAVEAAAQRTAEIKAAELEQIQLAHSPALLHEQQYQDQLTAEAAKRTQQRVQAVHTTFGTLSTLMASSSKKMFNTGKAASIASAIMSTHAAVVESFKNAGGFPWGIAPAAAMLAQGMMQVQNIKSQQFSGQAHSGLDNVPSEGTYLLQKGEMVLDPGTSQQVRNNAIGGDKNVNVTFVLPTDEYLKEGLQRHRGLIYSLMVDALNEEGQSFA